MIKMGKRKISYRGDVQLQENRKCSFLFQIELSRASRKIKKKTWDTHKNKKQPAQVCLALPRKRQQSPPPPKEEDGDTHARKQVNTD